MIIINVHNKIVPNSTIILKEDIKKIMSTKALSFVLKLNSHSHMTNKQIEIILKEFSENICTYCKVKEFILPEVNTSKREEISDLLTIFSNPFEHINTEHKINKVLTTLNLYQPPTQFSVQNIVTEQMRKGIPVLDEQNLTGTIMPIEFQIKKLFELPNFLSNMLERIKCFECSDRLDNFIQGELWKSKKKNSHEQLSYRTFCTMMILK